MLLSFKHIALFPESLHVSVFSGKAAKTGRNSGGGGLFRSSKRVRTRIDDCPPRRALV